MDKYDFFIAGRWRNKENVKLVLDAVRARGKSAYCFIENDYKGEAIEFRLDANPEYFMAQAEAMPQEDPLIRKIFETDITAERESRNFLLVLPAGLSGHVEAGIAYGMGKKCYAVGELEKTESLYCIFEEIFPTLSELTQWLDKT